MKKLLLLFILTNVILTTTFAQKFAYVDTDYILNKIPEFKQAQDKLDNFSTDWQAEIESKYAAVEKMYRAYQQEKVLLDLSSSIPSNWHNNGAKIFEEGHKINKASHLFNKIEDEKIKEQLEKLSA